MRVHAPVRTCSRWACLPFGNGLSPVLRPLMACAHACNSYFLNIFIHFIFPMPGLSLAVVLSHTPPLLFRCWGCVSWGGPSSPILGYISWPETRRKAYCDGETPAVPGPSPNFPLLLYLWPDHHRHSCGNTTVICKNVHISHERPRDDYVLMLCTRRT